MKTRIDRRVNYKIVLDTETCPIDNTLEGVDPNNMLVYDIGWAVTDKRGIVYKTRSFIVEDTYVGESKRMESTYYADKLPQYEEDIITGKRQVRSLYDIRQILLADMEEYGVKEVYAHNMRFDYYALNRTQEFMTNGRFKYFFPYGTEICDTLKMARDVIGKMPSYNKFCEKHGFLTKNGRVKMTAESLYAFIKNDPTFKESHTALEDVLIEKTIMAYCYRQKKAMRRHLWSKAS